MFRLLLIACAAAIAAFAFAPSSHAADAKQMEENKKTVAAFYDAALNKKDFAEASKYLARNTPSTIRSRPMDRRASRASSRSSRTSSRTTRARSSASSPTATMSSCMCMRCANPARAATRSSTSSGWRTARWWSTGTRCSRSRRSPTTLTGCSDRTAPRVPGERSETRDPVARTAKQAGSRIGAPASPPLVRDTRPSLPRGSFPSPAVIDVARFARRARRWNARSRKRCRRSSSATARPSTAKASWRSPRRCCSRA